MSSNFLNPPQFNNNSNLNLILGIDIGTTSIKVCLIDKNTRQVISRQSKDTQANVPSDLGTEGNKQYVPKIISALNNCISRLPKDQLRQVLHIGICGQMHGVMLWTHKESEKSWECAESPNYNKFDVVKEKVSAVYTWQDSRCDPDFLATLPKPMSHLKTYSGYGCATLFWTAKNRPDKIERYNRAGTIQDYVVAMLCDLDKPIMSVQNAASWGYFDTESKTWNIELLQEAGFPIHLLPDIVRPGEIAGNLMHTWYGIPLGTKVGAALGDLQCSVYATLEKADDAVMNISTSAQLAFIMPSDFHPQQSDNECVEYFPYFQDKYLAVAASLNGGNSLATFVRTLQQWLMELGFNTPQSKIWERILVLGEEETATSSLQILPTLIGERHSPQKNASVSNIDLSNLGLGQVFQSLCKGVVNNLHSMMPREMLLNANITRIVGIGSALTRNKVLQEQVKQIYQLPTDFVSGGDAAQGAALSMLINN